MEHLKNVGAGIAVLCAAVVAILACHWLVAQWPKAMAVTVGIVLGMYFCERFGAGIRRDLKGRP